MAREALYKQKARIIAHRLHARAKWEEQDLVFPTHDGGLVQPDTLDVAFKRWLARHELAPMKVHMLRHIAASYLVAQGVSLRVVAQILGHSDPTLRRGLVADAPGRD